MTDTAQWPLTSDTAEVAKSIQTPSHYLSADPLEYFELPRLVFPAPLVDKALLAHNDKEGS